jgi:hypothetical protein
MAKKLNTYAIIVEMQMQAGDSDRDFGTENYTAFVDNEIIVKAKTQAQAHSIFWTRLFDLLAAQLEIQVSRLRGIRIRWIDNRSGGQ